MSNFGIDLDSLVLPGDTREIFEPDSKGGWSGMSSRVYVSTHRGGADGVIQIGYDPDQNKSFLRVRSNDPEARWGDWNEVVAPAPPPEARKSKAADEETSSRSKK